MIKEINIKNFGCFGEVTEEINELDKAGVQLIDSVKYINNYLLWMSFKKVSNKSSNPYLLEVYIFRGI